MKAIFTYQEMKEAFDEGDASGRNKFVLDKRNDQEILDDLRKQYKKHNIQAQTFEKWMRGRFER